MRSLHAIKVLHATIGMVLVLEESWGSRAPTKENCLHLLGTHWASMVEVQPRFAMQKRYVGPWNSETCLEYLVNGFCRGLQGDAVSKGRNRN